jgi:ribonuclease I
VIAVDRIDRDHIGEAARGKAGAQLFAGQWRRTGAAAGSEQKDYRKTGSTAHDVLALIQMVARRKGDAAI